ncbi:MAG TPA: hypothetical protein VJW20_09415 [Candidatus Angelobacter sp.]|nr:hypothetical protein [Candidatus Angelobacter sp.]
MIHIVKGDPKVIQEIIRLRVLAYQKLGRDPAQCKIWSTDEFDKNAIHILKYDDSGSMIGAVRVIMDSDWTLEHYYQFPYNKQTGVEFGRLAALQKEFQGKRVVFELIESACRYCRDRQKTYFYGFVIDLLKRQLLWDRAPFEVLSPPLRPYGYPCYLVGFEIDAVLKYISQA